jgi:hypothetical protein
VARDARGSQTGSSAVERTRPGAAHARPALSSSIPDSVVPGLSNERTADTARGTTVPPIVREVLDSPGEELDSRLREVSEAHFGTDFSRIRVHTDDKAAASASSISARAYTVGNHIVFGGGQYIPQSTRTLPLLAHELVHALQDGQLAPSAGSALQIGHPDSPPEAQAATAQTQVISSPRRASGPIAQSSSTNTLPILHRQSVTAAPPASATTPDTSSSARGGYTGTEFANAVGEEAAAGGQFTWTNAIWYALRARMDDVGLTGEGSTASAGGNPDPIADIADYFRLALGNYRNKGIFEQLRNKIHAKIEKGSTGSWRWKGIRSLVGPDEAASEQSGKSVFDELWKANATSHGKSQQWIRSGIATLNHLRGMFLYEKANCWNVATQMGKKFEAATPATSSQQRRRETMMPNTQLIAEPPFVSKAAPEKAADKTQFARGGSIRGDEVRYRKDLPAIVDKMRTALADGWILHVRVISGAFLDEPGKGTPLEEHSLLLIGYSGDQFFAVDPDVGSNLAAPHAAAAGAPAELGRGTDKTPRAFQALFFDRQSNRLTTARSDADFPVHKHIDERGNEFQVQSEGTHRYQAVRVFTV